MALLRRFISGCRALCRRVAAERELDQELRSFIDMSIEEKVRAGMTREDAARAARVDAGSIAAVKDRVRDIGWETVLETSWRDVRYAGRLLRKSPAFTAVAVLTLALGIGATTAVFNVLDAVMFRSLPVRNPEELVLVGGSQYPVFQAFGQRTEIFTDLLATSGVRPLDVGIENGMRERTDVSLVSGSYFSTLGVQAAIGRVFTADEDRVPGQHAVAVASYGYWRRRFGRDPAILGRVVRIGTTPMTIIGVAPPEFFGEHVGLSPDLWVPLTMWGQLVPGRNLLESPGTGWLRLIGRLKPGVNVSLAQSTLTGTFRQVVAEIFGPQMPADVRRDTASAIIKLEPAGRGISDLRTQFGYALRSLMAAVIVVLLIVCANIANLLLARGAARKREIDLRLALGITRARLFRQLLTESLVLAGLGGAAGIVIAWIGREALLRLISADGSRLPLQVTMDARLLVFVLAISCATAIFFGLAPAWRPARGGLAPSLAGRSRTVADSQRPGAVFVVAQVALSVVLLVVVGLLLKTLANLREVDLGFRPERLLVADVDPPAAGYDNERAVALSRRLLDEIEGMPGVLSASLSEHGVLTGTDNGTNLLRPEGFVAGPEGFPRTRWDVVGPRYFSTIGTQIVSGRDFTQRDNAAAPFVVAINETMARLFFGSADAIGRRMVWDVSGAQKVFEIVAVTRDVKGSNAREPAPPRFYLPYFQMPKVRPTWVLARVRVLVRTTGDPASLAPTLRELVRSQDAGLAVRIDEGPALVSRTLVRERMMAILLIVFGTLAVTLACLGLYGVITYQVSQRTREIGIRLALGAQRADVLTPILQRGGIWIAAGIGGGIALALIAARVVQRLLFGVGPHDPGALIGAVAMMSITGLLAMYIPARRATRVDPLVALRCE